MLKRAVTLFTVLLLVAAVVMCQSPRAAAPVPKDELAELIQHMEAELPEHLRDTEMWDAFREAFIKGYRSGQNENN